MLLREGIEQLSPECREVMILKVVYRHSHHDIANEMGISTQVVERHIACAVRETHAYLRRHHLGATHAG